jgi:hypothetical protein
MRRSHPLYLALIAPGILAVAGVVWLAMTALKSAIEAGNRDVLLRGWVVAFVVGLPLLIAILPMVGALQAWVTRHSTIPNTGRKIP